ncbi:MAG: TetR/AcrR family transcriptional regulator [Oscillospiraceae bacterium]|nr:TetR/AcrR family transcriptional regulator [Oscillospiraceae bacterium]
MEDFFTLRAEKQNHIIDAALSEFGRNGYKKTSIADIAKHAGIAKGMITYYFGSKKNLYMYLAELCFNTVNNTMEERFDPFINDFFDKMKMMADIKVTAMKKHPAVYSFLASVYYEKDPEVINELNAFFEEGLKTREKWITQETDTSKFKDDIDPKLLDKFFVWAAEGFASSLANSNNLTNIEEFMNEFYTCMGWMKKYFYN